MSIRRLTAIRIRGFRSGTGLCSGTAWPDSARPRKCTPGFSGCSPAVEMPVRPCRQPSHFCVNRLAGKPVRWPEGASLLRGSHARRDIITRLADEPVLSGGFHIGVKLCEQSVVSRCSYGRYPEVFPLKRDNRDSEGAAADPDFR